MEFLDTRYMFAALAAIVVFTIYMAVISVAGRKEKRIQLEARTGYAEGGEGFSSVPNEELIGIEREKSALAGFCESFLKIIGVHVDEAIAEMRPVIEHAGIASIDAPYYILFMRRIGGYLLAFFGALFMLQPAEGTDALLNYILGGILVIAGLFGTKLYLKNRIQKRAEILQRSFPDTLDLMVVCVESGLALDAALSRVCRELGRAHPEITKELNRTRLELALLNDRSQALMNLAERTNLIAFRSLVAALIQTEKFGTSLTDTLRVLSEDYRLTRLAIAENKAGRLPVLMTIPLILLLMPAFLLIVLGPPFIRVSEQGGLFGRN